MKSCLNIALIAAITNPFEGNFNLSKLHLRLMAGKYLVKDKLNSLFVLVTGLDSEFRFNLILVMVLTKQRRVSASPLFLFKKIPFIVCAFCEQDFLNMHV